MRRKSNVQKLSVVVPCFNEEGHIDRIRKELVFPFQSLAFPCEFIFVDDGSSDQTSSRLSELKHEFPAVKVEQHVKNKGLGCAIRTGLDKATGDTILTLDADLTFHPKEVTKLLKAYKDDVDCVMGSPTLGKFKSVSIFRRILSSGVNLCYRILLPQPLTSMSSIFRLYRTTMIRTLNLTANHFDINADIALNILMAQGKVKEVPVVLTTRKWGTSKMSLIREVINHLTLFSRILKWRITT